MNKISWLLALLASFAFGGPGSLALACTAKDFADAVDRSGAELRALNLQFQPKLKDRLQRFKEAKKLTDANYEDMALDQIQDAKLNDLDAQSGALILKIDTMGRVTDEANPECAQLSDIKAASAELQVVIHAKSDYMLARLDEIIGQAPPGASTASPSKPALVTEPQKKAEAKRATPAPAAPPPAKRAEARPPAEAAPAPPATAKTPEAKNWTSKTAPPDQQTDQQTAAAEGVTRDENATPFMTPEEDGYSIEEIRDATRGFFGTISTNLAGIIEHAFHTSGRPTGYVLGTEGGGAFLAGLRYGSGTLYMRNQPATNKVFWHGPSLGYDVGAEGGRTLFLIYRLSGPDALYRSYAGIDGSAYVVGGVGITFLKGGDVIMAPIRSGLGLRLGANIGYVRFTRAQTWNPF